MLCSRSYKDGPYATEINPGGHAHSDGNGVKTDRTPKDFFLSRTSCPISIVKKACDSRTALIGTRGFSMCKRVRGRRS